MNFVLMALGNACTTYTINFITAGCIVILGVAMLPLAVVCWF